MVSPFLGRKKKWDKLNNAPLKEEKCFSEI
uniref:Uncharacterized protein n=1 Tax=Arundo donax TaxID=35708 RepID=A0A0A8XYM0_ARUDO